MGFSDNTAVTYYSVGQARFVHDDGDTHGVDLYLSGEDAGTGHGSSSGHFTMFAETARQLGAWLIQQAGIAADFNETPTGVAPDDGGEPVIVLGFDADEKARVVRHAYAAGFPRTPSETAGDVIVRWLHALVDRALADDVLSAAWPPHV